MIDSICTANTATELTPGRPRKQPKLVITGTAILTGLGVGIGGLTSAWGAYEALAGFGGVISSWFSSETTTVSAITVTPSAADLELMRMCDEVLTQWTVIGGHLQSGDQNELSCDDLRPCYRVALFSTFMDQDKKERVDEISGYLCDKCDVREHVVVSTQMESPESFSDETQKYEFVQGQMESLNRTLAFTITNETTSVQETFASWQDCVAQNRTDQFEWLITYDKSFCRINSLIFGKLYDFRLKTNFILDDEIDEDDKVDELRAMINSVCPNWLPFESDAMALQFSTIAILFTIFF